MWPGSKRSSSGSGPSRTLVPDGFCHWRLFGREGAFFLEWDRGTESMVVLSQKLRRYADYFRPALYRQHLTIDLKPRLLLVVSEARRREALLRWLQRGFPAGPSEQLPTLLVASWVEVRAVPLGTVWFRPGVREASEFWR